MNLRPHHLLCIQKFTGHGYDEAFTRHMTALVRALEADPESPVTLVNGCDHLCARCPNNRGSACSTPEKVDAMDSAVLAVCDLSRGVTYPWSALSALAKARIFKTDVFHKICQTCQWYDLCRTTPLKP